MESIKFELLSVNAITPERATPHSAGFDLFALESTTITGGAGNILVKTGVAVELPPNTYGRIAMRSGLSINHHLCCAAGVIDRDYRKGIQPIIFTTKALNDDGTPYSYTINKGERFAQLVIEHANYAPGEVVPQLSPAEYEHGGFGSTGYLKWSK